ncbi:MAG: hypothetical protein B7Z12_21730 [Caulobacter vibrioides]|uniref:Uncharacterized protein n=1 Tax=Caulobacter vibrioides TaxID=155892 RepID=A0A258CP73_CAUVI|nr:MAG: hypothetical protein B7Z12_21730 [Caulobacter vibrioides]
MRYQPSQLFRLSTGRRRGQITGLGILSGIYRRGSLNSNPALRCSKQHTESRITHRLKPQLFGKRFLNLRDAPA